MASFYDETGALQEVKVSIDLVKEACINKMTVRDYVNSTYPTDVNTYGDAFAQLCASEGLVLRTDRRNGLKAPTLAAALSGRPNLEAGAIVRQPTDQARVLLMPAIGALVEDKLVADLDMDATAFDSMLALDEIDEASLDVGGGPASRASAIERGGRFPGSGELEGASLPAL